ncbi:hypothetical protein RclHR1_01460020 [Rhizophagus clarus]|uniref:Kinase-like domain-containing protein n=1 Tax=Rhizophagus clarus TaxID=94130 RepID=A0A2Z6QCZ1_9GLOM|nr:hypothetical protein RclHR1_01460020 [Rhizophagus clarus]GET04727.1 kinase-like domain-containing protein [Rhizophagus clarus]
MGNASGINNLGYCGVGIDIDELTAFTLYQQAANLDGIYIIKKAANSGSIAAQHSLALMYESGDGIIKDINQAIYWYKNSSEQGNDDAKYNLAKLLAL